MSNLYHVSITSKSLPSTRNRHEREHNLSFEDLEKRFLIPYRTGKSLFINGRTIRLDDLERIRIFETEHNLGRNAQVDWQTIPDVTSKFITEPPVLTPVTTGGIGQTLRPPTDAREIFVVHGRNLAARDALFEFLRSIDLHPLEWVEAVSATGKPSPYIGEILDAAFSRAHAVLVLFTPDDEARLKEEFRVPGDPPHETELSGQARPNVLFEAGMAMSRSEDRTILVEIGVLRPFSDLAGRHAIRLNNSSQRRQELAQRLQAASCPVNLEGTDWHAAGDFDGAVTITISYDQMTPNVAGEETSVAEKFELSEDARELLTEATKDSSGAIVKFTTLAGLCFVTNSKQFGEMGDPRSEARWEGAVGDLLDNGLIAEEQRIGDKLFKVTREGFAAIDNIETPS